MLHRNHILPAAWPLRDNDTKKAKKLLLTHPHTPQVNFTGTDVTDSDSDTEQMVIVSLKPAPCSEVFEEGCDAKEDRSIKVETNFDSITLQESVLEEPLVEERDRGSSISEQVSEPLVQVEEVEEVVEEANVSEFQVRKSARDRRVPERYGAYLSHQHSVTRDWENRAMFLVSLVDIFPDKSDNLFEAILKLIMT